MIFHGAEYPNSFEPIEGNSKGCLSWKFDLSSTNLVILQATVSCPGTTYEDGEISWKICGSDHCEVIENGKRLVFSPILIGCDAIVYENDHANRLY